MRKDSRIYIAGHKGMVGSAIRRNFEKLGYKNLIFSDFPPYDLTDQKKVIEFFEREEPEYVILAAAKVGGIVANYKYRAQFIYENLMIQNNIIHQSYRSGVKKLLFLGSSCIYPKNAPQPLKEEYLLTDELEFTNEPYAIAKIAGIKMCESYNIQYGTNFISVMPSNMYGPNDNYDLEKSHVLPAMIRKFYLGKWLHEDNWTSILKDVNRFPLEGVNAYSGKEKILEVLKKYGIRLDISGSATITLWGTGKPYREFLYVDDMADACAFLMENVDFDSLASYGSSSEIKNTHINIGTGKDITIRELAELIRKTVDYRGDISWDMSKPDGTPRKLLDVKKINDLGWKETVPLEQGIKSVCSNYVSS